MGVECPSQPAPRLRETREDHGVQGGDITVSLKCWPLLPACPAVASMKQDGFLVMTAFLARLQTQIKDTGRPG